VALPWVSAIQGRQQEIVAPSWWLLWLNDERSLAG